MQLVYGFVSAEAGWFDSTWSSCGGGCHDSRFFFFSFFLQLGEVERNERESVTDGWMVSVLRA